MKEMPVEQGSTEWYIARLGVPTASMAHKILTPKTRKFSEQARDYAFRLVAEKLLNTSLDSLDFIEHIQRGKDMEPLAVKMFEAIEDMQTASVGFLLTDDLSVGATPDRRIVGENAFLEVKAPAAHIQLKYLIDGFGTEYFVQVQCQNYVGETDWTMRFGFHPQMPSKLEKTYRNESFISDLRNALNQFNSMKHEIELKARATGFFEEKAYLGQLSSDEILKGADFALK
jgi:hypothetical protein